LRVRVEDVATSRRRLVADTLGIALSAGGFGIVYGLSARAEGFSPLDAGAMSLLVFAGGAQFAAIGYLQSGMPWAEIVLLTAFINARHLLYGTVLRPYFADRSAALRAVMAHVLDDETFALSIAHFRRIGRADLAGYWIAAGGGTFFPWIVATMIGVTIAGEIPDPTRVGLDVVFPAAMGGLAVGLIADSRELVAAVLGGVVAIAVSLVVSTAAGIIAGGLVGPFVALSLRSGRDTDTEAVAAAGEGCP
jgi:4-azaleucine resistance transporter AzlC